MFVNIAGMDRSTAIARADAIVLGTAKILRTERGRSIGAEEREALREKGMRDADIDNQESSLQNEVYTTWAFTVEEALKGEVPTGELRVRTSVLAPRGGEVMPSAGYPQLTPGVRQVVFLHRGLDGVYSPVAVYAITGRMASTNDQGRRDNMLLTDLLAEIRAHKGDPDPWPPFKYPGLSPSATGTP